MQVDKLPPIKHREWLTSEQKDDRPKMRYTVKMRSEKEPSSITIGNLTAAEVDAVDAFLNGLTYLRCIDGRLHAYSVLEDLPKPEDDPICGPHWRTNGEVKQWGGIPDSEGWHSPGIIITGVGAGLDKSREHLVNEHKRRLDYCGFVCLRSPRGRDGRYWEQWVLPGLWHAKGQLKAFLNKLPETTWHQQANAACQYIAQDMGISFGSMDITIQRWALVHAD